MIAQRSRGLRYPHDAHLRAVLPVVMDHVDRVADPRALQEHRGRVLEREHYVALDRRFDFLVQLLGPEIHRHIDAVMVESDIRTSFR